MIIVITAHDNNRMAEMSIPSIPNVYVHKIDQGSGEGGAAPPGT